MSECQLKYLSHVYKKYKKQLCQCCVTITFLHSLRFRVETNMWCMQNTWGAYSVVFLPSNHDQERGIHRLNFRKDFFLTGMVSMDSTRKLGQSPMPSQQVLHCYPLEVFHFDTKDLKSVSCKALKLLAIKCLK